MNMQGNFSCSARIQMEDGTQRAACDVRIGDRIMTFSQAARIRNVITFYENEGIQIELETGNVLQCTSGLPVQLAEGNWTAALNIKPGVRLRHYGSPTSVCVVRVQQTDVELKFTNFLLEEGDSVIAEGLHIGAWDKQVEVEEDFLNCRKESEDINKRIAELKELL